MEQITMNEKRFTFRKLSMALGGLIILIGIPLFFWLAQMSIGTAVVPGAGGPPAESNQLDPARSTISSVGQEVEAPVVELATDKVWLISADVAQGETVGRYGAINVIVGYELVNVSEAELSVKLLDGPRGVLTAEKMVSGANGTVEILLFLADLEEVSGDSVALELNLILRDPNAASEKILYLDFVEGWIIDLTAAPEGTTAEIIQIGKPSAVEAEGLPANSTYEIELSTAYTLAGDEDAVLVVGYEFTDENGSAGGYEVTAISPGSGAITALMRLDSSFLDASGEPVENVRFFARINRYDEMSAEWVNLSPGNEPLLDSERSLPYPYLQDSFFVQSATWAADDLGRPLLNVTMGYKLVSQPTAEILVKVTGAEGTVTFASESILIEEGDGTLTLPLLFNQPLMANEPVLQVSAVLVAGDIEVQDEQAVFVEGQSQTAETESEAGEVWIIATEVVTRTTVNGVAADITLVVGYDLSNDYSGGRIDFANQFQASVHGGGSGGGGGSTAQITPGNGTTEFVFGFETTSWLIAQDWLNSMSSYFKLFGYTVTGDELLVGEAFKIGTD
jgi:hypothetical protein